MLPQPYLSSESLSPESSSPGSRPSESASQQFRRADPRYARTVEIELKAGGQSQTLFAKNLSLGGLFAETLEPLAMGTKVEVSFTVPGHPETIMVKGEVRWTELMGSTGLTGMGIRFQGLRAREVWALNRFFQLG